MTYDEFMQAFQDAEAIHARANQLARGMAKVAAGRLREAEVPANVLDRLKRELRDWDMGQHVWKGRKP